MSSIEMQRTFYDNRWAGVPYANRLKLKRGIAILDLLQVLNLDSPKILDLGCGQGWLTSILGRFGPATGLDLAPQAIRSAKGLYPDVRFIEGDFFEFQPIGETFDVVVSHEMIEHVEEQATYLQLIAGVLRPGGYLILTTPNAWNLAHWREDKIKSRKRQPIENLLTTKQLQHLLKTYFRILHLRTIVLGYGSRGVFHLINSVKVANTLKALGCGTLYNYILERFGFGRHICVLAQRL